MRKILKPIYHFLLAYLGAFFYGVPSRKLTIIGVTGTNGKTTVVHLVHHILNSSGVKTGSVSSLQFCIGSKCEKNLLKMTMPGRFALQRFLRRCVSAGMTHAVIEVTSQGVLQHRHRGTKFDYAVLTHVTPEHIEAHGGFEKYRASKLKFFEYAAKRGKKVAVVNADDPSAELFLAYPFSKKIKYSSLDPARDRGAAYFNPLLGEFNKANVMAAVKVAEEEGLNRDQIERALKTFPGVPGRLEFVQREPFAIVVDYAHTPDALKKVYYFLRALNTKPQFPNSRLLCVLGAAGGGRDKWKRPEFGKIAAEFCDGVVLTNEDPYDENPEEIISDIEVGIRSIQDTKYKILNTKKLIDRREAIREALKSAKAGDTVIITGKGAEPWIMGPDETKIAWDDREIVLETLKANR